MQIAYVAGSCWQICDLACLSYMVLLAGVKGTGSLELWNGQLSLSGKVLSPHMVSIKLGYLGNKTVDFEMGQTK